ncbi:MAG: CHAT domain-containing tetratricopeptide repeat protein [Phycisphaerae bacterium]
MSDGPVGVAELLAELVALPQGERAVRLRAAGPTNLHLVELGDEAERMALVAVGRAIEAATCVVVLADELGDARSRARARRALVPALGYSGRMFEALETCNEAARIADAGGEPIEAARARLASLHPLGELRRFDEALAAGQCAYETLISAGQPALAARADINLGGLYQKRDDPRRALFHLDRARAALHTEPTLLGFVENNRGEALLLLNDFAGAESAFQSALAAAEAAQVSLAAAIAEGNLGDLAARRGRSQAAMLHFERARRRLEKDSVSPHLARLLAEQAEALESLGMPTDALSGYREALPRLEAVGLRWETARAQVGIGKCLIRLGDLDAAARALQSAAEVFADLKHPIPLARANLIRAELLLRRGQIDDATTLIADAVDVLQDRPADAAVAACHEAHVALRRGDPAVAQRVLAPALAAVERLGIGPLRADVLHALGLAALDRNDAVLACEKLSAAVEQVESVHASLCVDRMRASFLGDRAELYGDLVRALLARGGVGVVANVFDAIERAKTRGLLERARGVEEAALESAGDSDEAALLRSIADTTAELNALYSRQADDLSREQGPRASMELRDAIHERERRIEQLELRVAATRSAGDSLSGIGALDEIRSHLPDDLTLVEYAFAAEECIAIAIRRGGTRLYRELGESSKLSEAVQHLHFQIRRAQRPGAMDGARAARLTDDARRPLCTLWDALMRPLRASLAETRRIIFVPTGPLHSLPFCALFDGDSYLNDRWDCSTLPSASVLPVLARRPPRAISPDVSLVVGVGDEYAPLIPAEARAIAGSLRATNVLIDAEATCEAVMRLLPRASLAHLACHGRFSSFTPAASGLKLFDRWFTLRDVLRLRLDTDLIALSGCDTGRAAVRPGDELAGLQRAFLAAGARSLLVSLWAVNDESATRMMARVYDLRLGGLSTTAALRQAQRELRADCPHPVAWAPFSLVGTPW